MKTTRPQVIGRRYVLQRQIGQGGMGAVWLAVDQVLGREVAIKRVGMFPGGTSPDLLRAQREAKLAARLNHPHVVAVFDFVTDHDEQWLVMEHVRGENLSTIARERGGLPPTEAAAILAQVAEALAAAHAAGIVHRDVKPSNIMVTDDGTAKLADFGIARARADSTLTGTGIVTGSPAYLAPEVVTGSPATEASDVWSLGATLFHTLTGRPPYESQDVLAVMYSIVNDPPPRLPDDGWPADLLATTMATDAQDRWPMSRVRQHLTAPPRATEPTPVTATEPLLPPAPEAVSVPGPATTTERRGGWVLALATGALLLLVVGAGWLLLRGQGHPSTSVGERQPGSNTTVASRSASQAPSPSPSQSLSPSPSPSPSLTPSSQPSSQPTAPGSGSPSPTTPTPTSSPAVGNASQMEGFARQYVALALADPESSWEQLTPRFQQDCCEGSVGNYAGYWNTITTATLRDVSADPTTMRVTYTITWGPVEGSPEDEVVTLGLVLRQGHYLIDDEL